MGNRKNFRIARLASSLTVALALAGVGRAQEAEEGAGEGSSIGAVTVDFASAYIFRGVTLNEGPVVQPGWTISPVSGLTLGVWGNLDIDDNDGAVDKGQFSEVDLSASYEFSLEDASLTLAYAEYLYPGADAEADREVSLAVGLPVVLQPSVTVAYGLGGAVEKNTYVELGTNHDIALTEEITLTLGVTVAYAAPDAGDSGFSHYTLGASLGYSLVSVGAMYIGQIDDKVLTDEQYNREWLVTVGLSYSF